MKRLLFILFLFSSPIFSQDYYYNYFSEKDGLSDNNVYKVIQDQHGYLWFATSSGVSKYDGVSFEEFSTEDGLTDYDILSLYEDSKGRIWFETFNGKPCFYLDGEIYNPDNHSLLKQIRFNRYIKNTFEDSSGHIWIGAIENSCRIDFESNTVTSYQHRSVFFSENDKKEVLIYSGSNSYFNTVSGKKEFIKIQDSTQLVDNARAVILLKNKNLLYSRLNRLNLKRAFQNRISPLKSFNFLKEKEYIISIYEDKNEVFLATNNGVVVFNGKELPAINNPPTRFLEGKNTTSVLKDHQGNIWVTTLNGVYLLKAFQIKKVNSSELNTTSFAFNEKMILSITANKKIVIIRRDDFSLIDSFQIAIKPKKIVVSKNDFFIITNNGTYKITGDRREEIFKFLSLKDIIDKGNHYYLADASGVYKVPKYFSKKKDFKFKNQLKSSTIKRLIDHRPFYLKDCDSFIYASTIKGLFKIKNDTVYPFLSDSDAYKYRVFNIDNFNDYFVLSTEGNGLYFYKKNRLIKHFNAESGLFSNQIKNVFINEDILYVVTKNGIQLIDKGLSLRQKNSILLNKHKINKADILDNKLMLATFDGLLYSSLDFNISSSIIKSEIKAYKENQKLNSGHKVVYDKKPIRFQFKIFNYSDGKINYKYRIPQLEESWNLSTYNTINYQNLKPGTYEFQLQSENKIINTFSFTILAPFWMKWWFIILAFLILVFLGFNTYKFLLNRKIKQASKEHEFNLMLAQAEQDALKAQMSPHFIFNSLNAIQNLILQNKTQNAYTYLGNFSKLVRTILNNSRNITTNVSNEIVFLKLYLELEQLRFTNKFNFEITTSENFDVDQRIPSMIIQPFVENSILHGLLPLENKSNANLSISFQQNEHFIFCIIEDNGIGRLQSKKMKKSNKVSLGLKITHDRLNLYDNSNLSNYTILDKEDGTLVKVKIRKDAKRNYN